ncbi:MAG: FG-GAP-like repeat-containing protein, partial [Lewinella sp.]
NWLQLIPEQEGANPLAVGTKATVFTEGQQQYLEHMPMRGFQSSMDYRMHFGLGQPVGIDSILLEWPDGDLEILKNVAANQVYTVKKGQGAPAVASHASLAPMASTVFNKQFDASEQYIIPPHQENRYSDFDRDPLLYHMLSAEGPALCAGKFTADGRLSFYLGGARDQAGSFGGATGAKDMLDKDKVSEDVACVCFDANGDGRDDVYVVSGSSEFGAASTALLDRLYLNRGDGRKFTKSEQVLPNGRRPAVGSVAKNYDVDGDGDEDLFVGSRMRPGLYGAPADSYLLLNDGNGNFTDTEEEVLKALGMVTDARWADVTGDGRKELIVVGEWMSPRVFSFQEEKLVESGITFRAGPQVPGTDEGAELELAGWYNALETADLNGDGRMDLILGNHGLNSRFRATAEEPVILHVNDFDQNGKAEPIISTWEDGKAYPMPLLHDLVKQMPGLRKRYLKYSSFGDQTMEDIFSAEVLERSVRLQATEFRSLIAFNEGNGQFRIAALPAAAQETPVFALLADDVDNDGDQDILLGGNFYYAKPETGRYDAGRGLLLLNDGTGNLRALSAEESGINIPGEIRDIIGLGNGRYIFGRNNLAPVVVARQ